LIDVNGVSTTPTRVDIIRRETTRLALVIAIREHPEWTLANLLARMDRDDAHALALRELTVEDLTIAPAIGPVRLAIAKRATGPKFDAMVHQVVLASTYPIKACELRARLGGPRWKLQASLGRLVDAGKIERIGVTSNTRYFANTGWRS
jgi:hypothetical protein